MTLGSCWWWWRRRASSAGPGRRRSGALQMMSMTRITKLQCPFLLCATLRDWNVYISVTVPWLEALISVNITWLWKFCVLYKVKYNDNDNDWRLFTNTWSSYCHYVHFNQFCVYWNKNFIGDFVELSEMKLTHLLLFEVAVIISSLEALVTPPI